MELLAAPSRAGLQPAGPGRSNARPHRAVSPSPMAAAGLPAGRSPEGREGLIPGD